MTHPPKTFAERVDEAAREFNGRSTSPIGTADFLSGITWLLTEMGLSQVDDPIEAVKKTREAIAGANKYISQSRVECLDCDEEVGFVCPDCGMFRSFERVLALLEKK